MTGAPGKLIRIYVNEKERYDNKPLYEAIVDRCRELHLAGVTVLQAFEAFGETSELHKGHIFGGDHSLVITIVETPEKAEQALPALESMLNAGVIGVTDVEFLIVTGGKPAALGVK